MSKLPIEANPSLQQQLESKADFHSSAGEQAQGSTQLCGAAELLHLSAASKTAHSKYCTMSHHVTRCNTNRSKNGTGKRSKNTTLHPRHVTPYFRNVAACYRHEPNEQITNRSQSVTCFQQKLKSKANSHRRARQAQG